MLTHAFLVVAALTDQARDPAPPGLIELTCNEVQRLFAALPARPTRDLGHDCAGRYGDDIKHAPAPATTDDRPPGNHEYHDLRLDY